MQEVAGKFLADNYKGKKVAILHDKTAYEKSADATRKNMKKAGLKEAMVFTQQVKKITCFSFEIKIK